ncbi:FMN reductase [Jezberella montanilacus]|uniref:FMN reductase n=1 Tax=Jezberella montanilacus TaxID=323426 RepID=A0A2T0XD42_9BURK|nr:NADPH-dependent FMN reductase [Jezberella montanilacus]PRY96836.1 FMN reductase [Jezberella montanilacus]
MSILLIAGSPTKPSRSAALLKELEKQLNHLGLQAANLSLRELPAEALVLAQFDHPALKKAAASVAQAEIIIIATPIYKAAYSGLLKLFLDILPQAALRGKVVLPLVTAGSPNHMLAIDYALRPVLQSMGAKNILQGIFAIDQQIIQQEDGYYQVDDELAIRLDQAVSAIEEFYKEGVLV